MNQTLKRLQTLAADGTIPWTSVADVPDIDASLDTRDDDPFDSRWVAENEKVQVLMSTTTSDPDTEAAIEDISRSSFVAVSQATDQHDLASYVSDDMRLLAEAVSVGYESQWLSALLYGYLRGNFPSGDISPVDQTYGSLLSEPDG